MDAKRHADQQGRDPGHHLLGHMSPVAPAIAETGYLRMGGIEQWVMMRGKRLANPPLILLHGGPGFSETSFFRRFTAPLEANFTLVYWDQRGAGKSFSRKIPKSSMSVAQVIADLDELVDRVRERLGHDKIAVFGHPWGSVLGVLYAARFPEKVSAYVGCEQIGDWPAAEAASYAYALGKAQRLGNAKAIADLRRIGPPPYSARSLFKERMWLQRLDGQLSAKALWNMGRIVLGCSETAVLDVPNAMRGFRFSSMPCGTRYRGSIFSSACRSCACGLLLSRPPGPLGAARDEPCLFRGAARAVQEARVVRAVRT